VGRSAVAEYCLRQYIADIIGPELTNKFFIIQSAGLRPYKKRWHCRITKKMREVVKFYGIKDISKKHKSKPVMYDMLNKGTMKFVYVMNQNTIDMAKTHFPEITYNLFIKDKNLPEDPYGRSVVEYCGCVILIRDRCRVLANSFVTYLKENGCIR
jgi:protein-tyrosine-phosphatase